MTKRSLLDSDRRAALARDRVLFAFHHLGWAQVVERMPKLRHAQEYRRYMQRVPAFFPHLSGRPKPA